MRSFNIVPILILITIMFLIDLYSFKGLKLLVQDIQQEFIRKGLLYLHWIIFGGFVVWIVTASYLAPQSEGHKMYPLLYYLFGCWILFYFPKIIFSLFELTDDIIYGVRLLVDKLSVPAKDIAPEAEKISRSRFLYQTGTVVAALPFIGIAYGILKGRFDFRVIRKQLSFSNLPKEFNGYKVVQISDAHLGSFFENYKPVERAIEMVNALEPDIIVFTGDLVNNYSSEAENWIPYFQKFKAKQGKFSIVGNHDYGDYGKWPSGEEKKANFDRLKEVHKEMGFRLLMNENERLEKDGASIGILGVENWGVKPFPQYGDVTKAKEETEDVPFKILLSHDPSHWDEVVRKEHQDVDITLSGHTHGMQFGIELGNIKWSPVKYKYPRWAGLYQEGKQFLYVNRGFGYIGFPGRVGMPPEITLLELNKA